MKLVIQRVKKGKVTVSGEIVGAIDHGLFILVGVGQDDTVMQADLLAWKLAKMRLMRDENDKMNLTVSDVGGAYLVVSQFTLYADTAGGNRPSFIKAASPDKARIVYDRFIKKLQELGMKVETGRFGEYMEIDVVLDGPVTIVIDG
jgi:D-aminoacyl-tRNA deacylase